MYNFHLNEKNKINDTICIFSTIDFCKNLHEYFFVQNIFFILKMQMKSNFYLKIEKIIEIIKISNI